MALAPVPSPEETIRLYQTGELGDELARYHEYEGDDDPFVAQCIELHNKGHIDLLAVPLNAAFAMIDGHSFFTAQHVFCEAIPKLQADVTALMECCRALIKQAGNDGAANQPNGAFQQWCTTNPDQARSVIARAQEGDPLAKEFASFAMRSANAIDTAIRFVRSYDDERRSSSMHALGHMRYPDAATAHGAIIVLLPFIGGGMDDDICLNALLAGFEILKGHPDPALAAKLVEAAIADAGPATLYGLAQAVWLHHKLMEDATLAEALNGLRAVAPEHLSTINTLDIALHLLIGTSREALALDFLTDMLRGGALSLENFDSIAHDLRRCDPQRLYRLVVHWLLSGSIALCSAVNDLVGIDRDRPFDATAAPLALTNAQQLFLCRKVIGFLFIKPVVACSIIVSVLRAAEPEVAENITELLFDPMLINYGGQAKDYLKTIPVSDAAAPFILSALAKDEAFHKGLEAMGTIKELHPSDYQRDVVWQHVRDDMAAAHKLAEKKSVLINLVHRSTILYGKRSLTYVFDPSGGRRAIAMDLKPYSTSFELPRHEILDPVGLDYMLRVFRMEKLR